MLMAPDHTVHPDLINRIRADISRPISARPGRVNLAVEPAFALGRARIHPDAHEYTIGGKPTRMQPRPLKVLVALHDRRGRVVSRDELIDRCWDGRIVGNDVINRCISLLRVLAMQTGGFRIETISGAGYRLVELTPTAKLELGPRPWMIGGTVAAVTALLSATAFVERAPASRAISTHVCAPRPGFAEYRSVTATGRNSAQNRASIGKRSDEIGKRSDGAFLELG